MTSMKKPGWNRLRCSPNARFGIRSGRAGAICTAACSDAGLSFEWHNFTVREELNWGKSFHPGSIEVCLNREGNGRVAFNKREVAFTPLTIGFYRRGDEALPATRQANQQHQFLTVEMSFDFLRRHLGEFVTSLHPLVRDVVSGQSEKSAVAPTRD